MKRKSNTLKWYCFRRENDSPDEVEAACPIPGVDDRGEDHLEDFETDWSGECLQRESSPGDTTQFGDEQHKTKGGEVVEEVDNWSSNIQNEVEDIVGGGQHEAGGDVEDEKVEDILGKKDREKKKRETFVLAAESWVLDMLAL